jgi:hypothetical protein
VKATAGTLLALLLFLGCGKKPETTGSDVHMVDTRDLLFSIPTLCDTLPATTAAPVPPGTFTIPEDDWRQMEFVAVADRAPVQKQLTELHEFKQKHRKGIGWDSVYVRHDRKDALLPSHIPWSKLTAVIGEPGSLLAIDSGKPLLVPGGFSKAIARGVVLYGQNANGTLASLALDINGTNPDLDEARSLLQRLADTLGLDVVDWYNERLAIQPSR